MNSSLKMALLGLFLFASSGVFAQSWTSAFSNAEVDIAVMDITCDGNQYLVFQVENKTDKVMTSNFLLRYNHDGLNLEEAKKGFVLPAKTIFSADCDIMKNFHRSLYTEIPADHSVDLSSVEVIKL